MIALARTNPKKGSFKRVEFVHGDIEDIPLQSEVADLVASNCVINLSLDKPRVFSEAFRILKPEGQLAISDIVLEGPLPTLIKESIGAHIACVAGAESMDNYISFIKDGFEDISIVKKTKFPIGIMIADPQLAQLAKELEVDFTDQELEVMAGNVHSVSIIASKR